MKTSSEGFPVVDTDRARDDLILVTDRAAKLRQQRVDPSAAARERSPLIVINVDDPSADYRGAVNLTTSGASTIRVASDWSVPCPQTCSDPILQPSPKSRPRSAK